MSIIKITQYKQEEVCAECGGKCCTSGPGLFHPQDFGDPPDFEVIKRKIHTGRLAMGIIDGFLSEEDRILLPTLRVKSTSQWGNITVYLNQFGHNNGVCSMFSPTGCTLGEEKPFQCKMLIPAPPKCHYDPKDNADNDSIVTAWLPFQEKLNELLRVIERMT